VAVAAAVAVAVVVVVMAAAAKHTLACHPQHSLPLLLAVPPLLLLRLSGRRLGSAWTS
jgi:hypothetical protein